MEELNSQEVLLNQVIQQIEAIIGDSYSAYLQLQSLTKQLIENGTIDKSKLALDMQELNELNAKLHKFSEPEVGGEKEEVPEVTE